ncbi:hypothetical protein, partial [Staphylococcus aureus]
MYKSILKINILHSHERSLHKCKGFSFHVLLSLTEILKGCLATMA